MLRLNNISKLALALVLTPFVACVQMEEARTDAVGYLFAPSLGVDVTVRDLTSTKADADYGIVAPSETEIQFVVKDSSGEQVHSGTGLWSEPLVLPEGDYTIEASCGQNGFEPYFSGSTEVTVNAFVENVPDALTLRVSNSLIKVTVHEELTAESHFTPEKVTVISETYGTLEDAPYAEWFHVPSDEKLTLVIDGRNSLGNSAQFKYELPAPDSGTAYSVVCKKSASWPSIAFTVDGKDVWATRIYVTSPADVTGVSANNMAPVVYEALLEGSSDWVAAKADAYGNIVFKGLEPGKNYQVRATMGALKSDPVTVTTDSGLEVLSEHAYNGAGELEGTDVTTVFSNKSDVVSAAISSWNISICDNDGNPLREGLALGKSEGASVGGWPYLPKGNYKVVAKVTMKDAVTVGGEPEVVELEVPFATGDPVFSITASCKTTFDYYKANDKANANAAEGSRTANVTSPAHSLFEIGSNVAGISEALLANENYSKSLYYAAMKDGSVVRDATYDGVTSKSHTMGDVADIFTDKRSYILKVVMNFAGTEVSDTDDFHITGLPYSVSFAGNAYPSGWALSNTASSDNLLCLKITESSALSPEFYLPESLNVTSALTAYAYSGSVYAGWKMYLTVSASSSVSDQGTTTTLNNSNNYASTASFSTISNDLQLTSSANRVSFYMTGEKPTWAVTTGGRSMGIVCKSYDLIYKL